MDVDAEFIATVAQVLATTFAGVGLLGVGKATKHATDELALQRKSFETSRNQARGELLFTLAERLKEHEDVHLTIKRGQWPADPTVDEAYALTRYMGLFEIVQVLLQSELLTLEEVDNYLSHRIALLANTEFVQRKATDESGWRQWNKLLKALAEGGKEGGALYRSELVRLQKESKQLQGPPS